MDCPICQSVAYLPRLYECGHTCCHLCMLKNDAAALDEAPSNTLPLYRCPICRRATLQRTEDRPINHALAQIIENKLDNFSERSAEAIAEREKWLQEYKQTEHDDFTLLHKPCDATCLPEIAYHIRVRKSALLYQRVLNLVLQAACKGHRMLTITTHAGELCEFAEEITEMLFARGIYAIHATPRKFTVYILKSNRNELWGEDWVNPNYNSPHSIEVAASEEMREESV